MCGLLLQNIHQRCWVRRIFSVAGVMWKKVFATKKNAGISTHGTTKSSSTQYRQSYQTGLLSLLLLPNAECPSNRLGGLTCGLLWQNLHHSHRARRIHSNCRGIGEKGFSYTGTTQESVQLATHTQTKKNNIKTTNMMMMTNNNTLSLKSNRLL